MEIRSAPGQHERPDVEEIERILGFQTGGILGFQTGDTDAPGLSTGNRTTLRLKVLGRCFDVRAMTHILNTLPGSPQVMEGQGG